MNNLALVILILTGLCILVCVIMMYKNAVTYRNHSIIINAIFDYRMDNIRKANKNGTLLDGVKHEVDYDDMRDYNSTFMRFFDWGYKNILPDDKFEIIKPYIHK